MSSGEYLILFENLFTVNNKHSLRVPLTFKFLLAILVESVPVSVRRNKSTVVTNAGGENCNLYIDDVAFNLLNNLSDV